MGPSAVAASPLAPLAVAVEADHFVASAVGVAVHSTAAAVVRSMVVRAVRSTVAAAGPTVVAIATETSPGPERSGSLDQTRFGAAETTASIRALAKARSTGKIANTGRAHFARPGFFFVFKCKGIPGNLSSQNFI